MQPDREYDPQKEYVDIHGHIWPWYDLSKYQLSRNPAIGFDIGSRGIGKTYSWSHWAFATWRAKAAMWAILVRRRDELKAIRQGFWTNLYAEGYETKTDGIMCLIRDAKPRSVKAAEWAEQHPWQPYGFFLCMTDANTYKQNSAQFSSYPIDKMMLDEFIIEDQAKRYLDTEPAPLTSIASSVFRTRRRRVTAFSNAGFIHNPYFSYYGVTSGDFEQSDYVWRNDVLFHYTRQPSPAVYSEGLRGRDKAYQTENAFRDVTGAAVIKRPKSARPRFSLITREKSYRVYGLPIKGWLYVEANNKELKTIPTYTLDPYLIARHAVYDPDIVKLLRRTLHINRLRFHTDDDRADIFDYI